MFRNMYPNQILIFSQVWIFSLANSSISLQVQCRIHSWDHPWAPEPPDCLRMWSIRTTHPWWNTPSNATPTGYQRQTLDTWPIGPWKITENMSLFQHELIYIWDFQWQTLGHFQSAYDQICPIAPSVVTQVYRNIAGWIPHFDGRTGAGHSSVFTSRCNTLW